MRDLLIPTGDTTLPAPTLAATGWLGVIGPVVYVATWAIAGALVAGYDPVADAISELAAVGAPAAPAMTGAFVVFGLTAVPFARGVRQVLPRRAGGIADAVAIAIVVTGLSTVAAGLFPCSPGCPGPGSSFTDNGHAVTATVGYLALMASPLLAAWHTWPVRGWRGYARMSAVVGIAGSLGMAWWALGLGGDAGGALQRGFNTIADVWWAITGVLVVRHARRQRA